MPDTAPGAVPPAPPVPLAALLELGELGLRRIAGPGPAGVMVQWVHTSEMADPYPYLLGGELLLSAGVLLDDPNTYVSRVVAAGAAALGFGVAPVHDTVPPGLIDACERHGLPLLEVPPSTTFTAVTRAVWRLMARARHRELRRVTRAQQGLATAAARPDPVPAVLGQLAARLGGRAVLFSPDGTELSAAGRAPSAAAGAALARLARVVRDGGAESAPAGAPAGEPAWPAPASASDSSGGVHLSAYALGAGRSGRKPVLGLATADREPGDHTVAGVAAVLLSLLTAPHQGPDGAGRSAALVRLLLGAPAPEAAEPLSTEWWTVVHARGGDGSPLAASALGAALGSALVDPGGGGTGPDGTVRVLLPSAGPAQGRGFAPSASPAEPARGRGAGTSAEPAREPGTSASPAWEPGTSAEPAREPGTSASPAPDRKPEALPGPYPETTPAPYPAPDRNPGMGASPEPEQARNPPAAPPVAPARKPEARPEPDGEPGTTVPPAPDGRSPDATALPAPARKPAPPRHAPSPAPQPGWTLGVSDPVRTADLPAADIRAARALRRALATHREVVRHRSAAGLADLIPPEDAAAHARLRLAPLAGSPALLETLRVWLSLHGGWDRTAAAMEIHRNTVRQRIARCAALLGDDLDDADVRMELWFALRLL
ncbi:PucR family transcriptional regulator ligand-binding domain-containing protein [Streptomyces sp. CAU 1734]|uniref:PucR family transcriptional regulator ligand-binding domain-containing protein n=1 Tax=Streptomyces sp. CAU 1734 TaxID=3140360 RepID=UPI00325FE2FF